MSGYTFYPSYGGSPRAQTLQPVNLFVTRIWQAKLGELSKDFPRWAEAVEAMRAASPAPAGRSNRLGWNSADKAVLEQPVFASLRDAVRGGCQAALAQMGAAEARFDLESWVNMHDRGGFNFLHIHEGSLLSGTFYLQVPEGSGCLMLRDPRPGVLNSSLKGNGPNAHSDVQLRPETGLMVLFPSWLEHFVEPHESDTPRISISFNAIPRARPGS